MPYSDARVAGTLFFIATSQFVLGLVIAEARYPGYSVSANYVSDLGVGPSSAIFNSSVFLLGLLLIIGTCFLQRAFNFQALTATLILTGIGAMGVGVFTEHSGRIHTFVSLIAFVFGALSAIVSYRLLKSPFSILAVILGLMDIGALTLFALHVDLGLGVGGMERMILYPVLIWGAGLGAYLVGQTERQTKQKP
jgi:hypothetical membrane protein